MPASDTTVDSRFAASQVNPVGPGTRRLLENQSAAQPRIVVSVRHGVVRPRAIFGVQQPARVASKLRRARRVNHVGEPVQRVVLQGEVRTDRIIDEGEVADVVIAVNCVALRATTFQKLNATVGPRSQRQVALTRLFVGHRLATPQ